MNDPNYDTPIATVEQAKDFFRHMGCSHFHMAREFPERYQEYQRLRIPKQLETDWQKEKFHEYYESITGNTSINLSLWMIHSSMYDLYESLKTEEQLSKLLEVTYFIRDKVPPMDRVIVAETINGRTVRQARRGLIYLSYDLGRKTTAREFVELSFRFSECKDDEIDETALLERYGDIPLRVLKHTDYKSHHLERCQKATNKCIEIKKELGL